MKTWARSKTSRLGEPYSAMGKEMLTQGSVFVLFYFYHIFPQGVEFKFSLRKMKYSKEKWSMYVWLSLKGRCSNSDSTPPPHSLLQELIWRNIAPMEGPWSEAWVSPWAYFYFLKIWLPVEGERKRVVVIKSVGYEFLGWVRPGGKIREFLAMNLHPIWGRFGWRDPGRLEVVGKTLGKVGKDW